MRFKCSPRRRKVKLVTSTNKHTCNLSVSINMTVSDKEIFCRPVERAKSAVWELFGKWKEINVSIYLHDYVASSHNAIRYPVKAN